MEPVGRIRVLVVDDHPVFADGIAAMLASQGDMVMAGRAGAIAEAVEFLATERVEVVLVDLRLPDGLGTELLAHRGADQVPAMIVLSTYKTKQYLQIAMNLGASGFLLKTAPSEEILDAIRRAASGGVLFSAQQLQEARAGWVPLSPREREVIAGVVNGRSNDEIGGDMAISRKTVEFYLARLFERYGVTSRTELAVRAERESWLELPTRPEPPRR